MNKSITQNFKRNIIVLSIIVTFIFLMINVSLYIINNNFLVNKVKEENEAFLLITTHIINENDLSVAIEYIEHYTHIHEVNIELLDENSNMLFSSEIAHKYTSQYQIDTEQGAFTVFIDNTGSITVNRIEKNTIYVNISLVLIYIVSLFVLIHMNRNSSKAINRDIENVLDLIHQKSSMDKVFNHQEFQVIYQTISEYLENIDLLTEQKEMNIKGLAHDIKTPLTIVYSYFERVLKEDDITVDDKITAFESSKKINVLLNDIIEDNARKSVQNIDLFDMLSKKQHEYQSIFTNKNIKIELHVTEGLSIVSNEKDLSRVLDNLISNAYYYSRPDSVFTIEVTQNKQTIITCTSTPQNIHDIDITSIFKKGYRGKSSHDTNGYGKGLGLYLCKILLKNMGGSITPSIENENVKFTIML